MQHSGCINKLVVYFTLRFHSTGKIKLHLLSKKSTLLSNFRSQNDDESITLKDWSTIIVNLCDWYRYYNRELLCLVI